MQVKYFIIVINAENEVLCCNNACAQLFENQIELGDFVNNYINFNRNIFSNISWELEHLNNGHFILFGTDKVLVRFLQEENAQLHYILKKIPGYVFWKDRSSILQGCNENFAHQVGLSDPAEVIGLTDYDLPWTREQTEMFLQDDQEVMESGTAKLNIEEKQRQLDGNIATLLTSKSPICDNNGKVTGVLGSYFDISKIKEAEHKLKMANEQSVELDKMKSTFLRNMEHDIRTPIAGITGLTNMLAAQEQNKDKQQTLYQIGACATELLDYCNAVFELSSISQHDIPIFKKNFSIKKLIETVIALENPSIKNKNLKLKLEIKKNVPKYLLGDEFRIYRVLLNLLSNAIKFSSHGSISISVSCIQTNKKTSPILQLIINNNGKSIDQKQIDALFNTNCLLENDGVGIGMGLRIVKNFLDDLGGQFKIEGKHDVGTTVTCLIPCESN